MKRIYYPHTAWEEVAFGMYSKSEDSETSIAQAVNLLSSPSALYHFMKKTTEDWPNSTIHNMTNPSRNKQAWLGQASCCFFAGASEDDTKIAWSRLTDEQRIEANEVADKVIAEWEVNYAKNI